MLWKGRSKRKLKRFDIEAYYRNKNKMFWFGPLIIGTKAELFNLFQNDLKSNRNVSAFFKVQKRNQNETNLISYRIKTFLYTYASDETKRNFCELFPKIFTSSESFCLLQPAQESKQNFCIFKKWYQNKTKTLQIVPEFSKDKIKLFVVPKKFGNRTEQKLLDQIFLVLIENVLFQKLIYIRSFLEEKQQNESFRSWKNVDLTLLGIWRTNV